MVQVLEQFRLRCTGVLVVLEPTPSAVCTKLPEMASSRAWYPMTSDCGPAVSASPQLCPPEWLDGHIII
jgi:hypothetical protein